MFPSNPSVYPKFVPDQILTAHDLNELFGYLDEQGRMTRTNLIGIGIVCGLQVQLNTAQNQLTITKGVGVTSKGYLISVPSITYTKQKLYDKQLEEETYDLFINPGPPIAKKFDLWELKQDSTVDATPLTGAFLGDKVAMLFVELLQVGNKNCDPNSCDDKGKHFEVTFRPLLVRKSDAASLILSNSGTVTMDTFTGLPEVRLRRFDVPNTNPVTTKDIFDAYQAILSGPFLASVEDALTKSYDIFSVFINTEYPTNPFNNLAANYAFLNNGSINSDQLKHIQYFYDLFSDILLAYYEFRRTGMQIISACCPDVNLFPRHLLLGEAIPLANNAKSSFRHYFIYSPLFEQKNLLLELKSLFRRLVLLKLRFTLPPVVGSPTGSNIDPNIRITPSRLDDSPLSRKAIPYYYDPVTGSPQLYMTWDFDKTMKSIPQYNLSYNADKYSTGNDFIVNPLNYDLEPYNFLRVEGIIGKQYTDVMRNVKRLIGQNRLPVDIIALNTENAKLFEGRVLSSANAVNLTGLLSNESLMGLDCHFQDLEALYLSMKSEMLCTLCKELKYYYELPLPPQNAALATVVTTAASNVPLFNSCSPGYMVRSNTYGFLIEKVYSLVGNNGNLTFQILAEALGYTNNAASASGSANNLTGINSIFLGYVQIFFEIPLYIIRLASTFTANLGAFDVKEYCSLHKILVEKANNLKFLANTFNAAERQEIRLGTLATGSTAGAQPNLTLLSRNINLAGVSTTDTAPGIGTTGTTASGITINTNLNNLNALRAFALDQTGAGRVLQMILTLEDFFDHLDVLIYNCKCSAFSALRAEYLRRVAYLTLLRQFGYFTKLHPGIQHKAGVPMGGTFIIVYHSRTSRVSTGSIKGRFLVNGRVIDNTGASIPSVTIHVSGTSLSTMSNAEGEFSMYVNELPVTVSTHFLGTEPREVLIDSEGPVNLVIGTTDTPAAVPDVMDNIADGMVIADFYLPYRCCSDCPPIQYVIKDSETPTPENRPPIASAGNPQIITLPTNSVTLNGSASFDPDGNTGLIYQWKVTGSPAGSAPQIVSEFSSVTVVNNLVQGSYEFEITVTDPQGASDKDTTKVEVLAAEVPQKVCGPLSDIIQAFDNYLNTSANTGPFNAFITVYTSFNEVGSYFKLMKALNVPGMSVPAQIQFFATSNNAAAPVPINDLLYKWLKELGEIVRINADLRLLALLLYRILVRLAMYVVCIQAKDFNAAEIQMTRVFQLINSQVKDWGATATWANFSQENRKVVREIGSDMSAENARVDSNGEGAIKPLYKQQLKDIFDFIASLP